MGLGSNPGLLCDCHPGPRAGAYTKIKEYLAVDPGEYVSDRSLLFSVSRSMGPGSGAGVTEQRAGVTETCVIPDKRSAIRDLYIGGMCCCGERSLEWLIS